MKFKEGDRIRLEEDCSECLRGEEFVLRFGNSYGGYMENLYANGSYICQYNWELVEPAEDKSKQPTITMKLTNAFKKFLSADLQAQVKAGYRNESLELTEAGKTALLEILADANKEAFTASANEVIADQEKHK